jgi:hypothetical protein
MCFWALFELERSVKRVSCVSHLEDTWILGIKFAARNDVHAIYMLLVIRFNLHKFIDLDILMLINQVLKVASHMCTL